MCTRPDKPRARNPARGHAHASTSAGRRCTHEHRVCAHVREHRARAHAREHRACAHASTGRVHTRAHRVCALANTQQGVCRALASTGSGSAAQGACMAHTRAERTQGGWAGLCDLSTCVHTEDLRVCTHTQIHTNAYACHDINIYLHTQPSRSCNDALLVGCIPHRRSMCPLAFLLRPFRVGLHVRRLRRRRLLAPLTAFMVPHRESQRILCSVGSSRGLSGKSCTRRLARGRARTRTRRRTRGRARTRTRRCAPGRARTRTRRRARGRAHTCTRRCACGRARTRTRRLARGRTALHRELQRPVVVARAASGRSVLQQQLHHTPSGRNKTTPVVRGKLEECVARNTTSIVRHQCAKRQLDAKDRACTNHRARTNHGVCTTKVACKDCASTRVHVRRVCAHTTKACAQTQPA